MEIALVLDNRPKVVILEDQIFLKRRKILNLGYRSTPHIVKIKKARVITKVAKSCNILTTNFQSILQTTIVIIVLFNYRQAK